MNTLLSLLESIQNQSKELFTCLLEEKQALENNQYNELVELVLKKQAHIDQLQSLEQQRINAYPDKEFNAVISESSASTQTLWQQTLNAMKKCKEQNEVNGRILNKRTELNQQLISLLSGKNSQQNLTYNAQGNQTKNSSLLNDVIA